MPSISAEYDFRAAYFDGRTAQRHAVRVRLRPDALDVLADDGHVLDQWLYDEIELSDQGGAGTRVIKRGTEARLLIADAQAFAMLRALAPNLINQRTRTMRNIVLSITIMVALAVAGYISLPLLSDVIVRLIPLETEVRIGNAYADDVAAMFSPNDKPAMCAAPAGRRALDAMVSRLVQFSDGPFVYRVDVLDTPMVNALALPGGRIFLFRGLIDKAQTADEVAGVLAHEMQHVNLRHGMQALVRSYGVNLLTDMMFGGNMMGDVSRLFMMMSYSRKAEFAADEGAIDLLRRSGVGTAGMAAFFTRLKEQDNKKSLFALPQLLSTHPPSAAREELAKQTQTGASRAWTLGAAEWSALKSICP